MAGLSLLRRDADDSVNDPPIPVIVWYFSLVLIVMYLAVSLFQVWSTGQSHHQGSVDAIVVMGAAQYDGRPSPQLQARLDHVVELWNQGARITVKR